MDKEKVKNTDTQSLMSELQTSTTGLTVSEAQNRLVRYGQNILRNESKKSVFELLIKQLKSSLVYLLLVAASLSFVLREFSDGVVILVILFINTGLGFYQEFRSEKAVEKLQKLVDKDILVIRSGQQTLVPEKLIVPGDV